MRLAVPIGINRYQSVTISEYSIAPPRGRYGWISLIAAMEKTVMTMH
jgi:hypothetical protein